MGNEKKVRKFLTYEQIGEMNGISPQQVHKIEKEAINKMVETMCKDERFNIFEIIIGLSDCFGVSPEQVYGKLNASMKQLVYDHVYDTYGQTHEDYDTTLFSKDTNDGVWSV